MLRKIISGGQTGADRAALDFAIVHGIAHGGWCPRGRWAEDGTIDARYSLTETPSSDPAQRTEWNVRDSDGTLIISVARELVGGSKLTMEFAAAHQKPWLHLWRHPDLEVGARHLSEFLETHPIKVLNIAGPRSSEEPGVEVFVKDVCNAVLGNSNENLPGKTAL